MRLTRMGLIKETAEGLKKRGMRPEFGLAIHGPATKYVAKSLNGTKFEKDKSGNSMRSRLRWTTSGRMA